MLPRNFEREMFNFFKSRSTGAGSSGREGDGANSPTNQEKPNASRSLHREQRPKHNSRSRYRAPSELEIIGSRTPEPNIQAGNRANFNPTQAPVPISGDPENAHDIDVLFASAQKILANLLDAGPVGQISVDAYVNPCVAT